MAINIQNIIAALEAKVAAATSATETQELIVIIKSIKAAGQQTIVTYADVPNLPTASADNAGNLAYVAAAGKIYYSNGTTWTEVGSGSGGGGGTAYDQSLNTTDDVVFNSALVGDVSIVGNEISGTDSYGNNTALVVSSEMQVNVGSVSTFNGNSTNNSITLQLYNYDISFFVSGAGYYLNEDFVRALYNNDPNSSPVVSVTFPGAIGMSDTVVTGRLKANGGGNAGEWVYGNTNPATIQNIYFDTNYINEITVDGIPVTSHPNYNNSFIIGQQVTFTTGSQTTPLSVTASGVNVDGTFTVNGQPVSGGSGFDGGSLVATDALIGDVSIVGNEISGVDAYGNDAALVVTAPVDFNFTGTTTSVVQTLLSMNGVGFQQSSMNGFQIYSLNGSFQSEAQQILNLPQGTVITTGDMFNNFSYQNVRFRFSINTVMSTPDMYNPSVISAVYMYPIGDQFEYSTDGGQTWTTTNIYSYNFNNGFVNLYLSFEAQSVVNSVETAVSITETGLNVNGALTVNGQPLANYDQSLNTTDDVVFNSALVGDVSIIGNQISSTDAYGNDATLVLNSPVEFKSIVTSGSETIIDFGASTSIVPAFNFGTYAQYVSLQASSGFGPTPAQQLVAIPSGTLVTTNVFSRFDFMTYQTENKYFRFVVDGTPTSLNNNPYDPSAVTEIRYTVVSGTLESSTDGVNWISQAYDNYNYQTTSSGIITYGGATTVENTIASISNTGVMSFGGSEVGADLTIVSKDFIQLGEEGAFGGNSGYGSQLQLYRGRTYASKIVPNTTLDGGQVERLVIGEKTTPTSPTSIISNWASAAFLNGDISIIEVVVSAINVDTTNTPTALNAKSWKIRGYATKVNNMPSFTQIGTTEVLANTGTGTPNPTDDLIVTLGVSTSGTIQLEVGQGMSASEWTWGGEITTITTHVLVPSSGGGGK